MLLVSFEIWPLVLGWYLFGGLWVYHYGRYRGSKNPSEYGLTQFLRDYDWPDG